MRLGLGLGNWHCERGLAAMSLTPADAMMAALQAAQQQQAALLQQLMLHQQQKVAQAHAEKHDAAAAAAAQALGEREREQQNREQQQQLHRQLSKKVATPLHPGGLLQLCGAGILGTGDIDVPGASHAAGASTASHTCALGAVLAGEATWAASRGGEAHDENHQGAAHVPP